LKGRVGVLDEENERLVENIHRGDNTVIDKRCEFTVKFACLMKKTNVSSKTHAAVIVITAAYVFENIHSGDNTETERVANLLLIVRFACAECSEH
jgi:hypothetical protein